MPRTLIELPTASTAVVRPAGQQDGDRLADIYNHYIRNTVVTFEEDEVTGADMAARVAETGQAGLPWLVAVEGENVAGYAYASKWKGRCAYRHSVEVTVYLDPAATGRGLGRLLYGRLFPLLRERTIHVAIGGIALPNEASIALHERFGMRKVAHFSEVGFKFEKWVDVGYWQVELDGR